MSADHPVEAPVATRPDSPYKGLASYEDTDLDAALFFGRERDSQILAANLVAFRLTVLYGPSGVGKSSILRAGVARELRREEGLPVAVFSSWSGDPVEGIIHEVARVVGVEPPPGRLADALGTIALRTGREVYLVLDQTEEYFVYHEAGAADGGFAEQFPELVGRGDIPVNVLLAIREDALAALDRFKPGLPTLFGNCVRLGPLDDHGARAAITGPLDEYSRLVGSDEAVSIEPELVDAVLGDVSGSEASYLQLVMERLWDEERSAGSRTLRLSTFERLGGWDEIARTHLDESLGAPRRRATRRRGADPESPGDAVGNEDRPQRRRPCTVRRHAIVTASRQFWPGSPMSASSAPFPRQTIRVERAASSFHDVLARPALDWRARHETVAASRSGAGGGRPSASPPVDPRRFGPCARGRHGGGDRLRTDPAPRGNDTGDNGTLPGVGGKRGLQAANRSGAEPSPRARRGEGAPDAGSGERVAAGASRVASRHGARPPARLTTADFGNGTVVVGGKDGRARLVDPANGEVMTTLDVGSPITTSSFNDDSSLLVTVGEDGVAQLWHSEDGSSAGKVGDSVVHAAWGPGDMLVTAAEDGTAELTGEHRTTDLRRPRCSDRDGRRQSGRVDVPDSRAGRAGARLVSRDRETTRGAPA